MATTTFPPVIWPMPMAQAGVAPNFTAFGAMNASGDRVAIIVQVPKSGTLDKFEVRTGTVSNNPDNGIRYSFQDVATASGNPDGVVDQFRDITAAHTTTTWTVPGLMTDDGTDTGVKRTVTRGEWLACVMDFVNFVASDSIGFATLRTDTVSIGAISYTADGSSGSYTKGSVSHIPILALKYDDGSYATFGPDQVYPIQTINTYTINSGSTPDEVGNKYNFPVPVRVKGAWFHLDLDNDCEIVLYNAASSVLESIAIESNIRQGSGTLVNPFFVLFDTSISIAASTDFRVVFKPGASNCSVYGFQAPGSAYMAAMPLGTYGVKTTRVDAGSWTDATDEQIVGGLILDGFDDGTGGSGGSGGSFTFVG